MQTRYMKNARPLWQRDEDETTGDSIERLVIRGDYREVASLLEDGDEIPKGILWPHDVVALAGLILPLVLQPDDERWHVERWVPTPKRHQRVSVGRVSAVREFKAVR